MAGLFQDFGTQGDGPTIRNILRSGIVVAQDPANCRVRVNYPDQDGRTTYWLPVLQRSAAGTKDFWLPNKGDQVHVIHYGNGIETGVVIGCSFTPYNKVPTTLSSPQSRHLLFNEGTYFDFNPNNSTLNILSKGPMTINTQGPVQLTSKGDVDVTTQGNLNATVTGNVEVSCKNLDATASGETTINSPTITLNANNVIVTGILKVDFIKTYQAALITATPQVKNADGSGGGS